MAEFNLTNFSSKQLAFERHYHFLFKHLNFELCSGELLQVRGNNGTGKSTLLRILAGFIEPHEGQVLWHGKSIFTECDNYQEQIHYLGHQNGLKLQLTIYENLALHFALANKKADFSHLNHMIAQMNLSHQIHTKASQLSAGQLRRLAMLRLIANPVPLWILDEPITALDAAGQQLLMHFLGQHLANKGMAIIATHQNLPFSHIKTIRLGEMDGA